MKPFLTPFKRIFDGDRPSALCCENRPSTKRGKWGFTLIEIMVVIAIIGMLAAIAIPVYRKITLETQNMALINEVMDYSDAFNSYNFLNGTWPPTAGMNKIPNGMIGFLPNAYTQVGVFGGEFHWIGTGKLQIKNSDATTETMTELDEKIDDGDLSTGQFKKQGAKMYVLQF